MPTIFQNEKFCISFSILSQDSIDKRKAEQETMICCAELDGFKAIFQPYPILV